MLLSILSIRVSNFKIRLVSGLSASSMAALISDTTIRILLSERLVLVLI